MKVYNNTKTQELTEYDLNLGQLKEDKIIHHIKAKPYIEEKGHYETIREYENGGKDVEWVVDVKGQELVEEHNEEEDIYVYVPYTKEELLENKKDNLRNQRESECFSIINRGQLWYASLTEKQLKELNKWYKEWLDVTITLKVPNKPEWIK